MSLYMLINLAILQQDVFAWSPWKVEIKNVSVGRVNFGSLFSKKRLHARHDVNGH